MENEDLALFLGMLCGDGHLSIHHKKRSSGIYLDHCVGFCNTNEKIIGIFDNLFYKILR